MTHYNNSISLTSVACKVLEQIIIDQLHEYLAKNSLICKEQHRFVPMHSTTTNLLCGDHNVAQHLNASEPCDPVLLDFNKAFDKVPLCILLAKLLTVGIC